jgi:hypothetical protein
VGFIKNNACFPHFDEKDGYYFDDEQVEFIYALIDEYEIEDPIFDDVDDDKMPVLFDHNDEEAVRDAVVDFAIRCVLRSIPVAGTQPTEIEFDDMLYLTLLFELPLPKYDLVLTDESQDFNACQILLLERLANGR